MKKSESGSAHVIIIAILAIALVSALGMLFWQNIISKPKADDSKTVASVSPTPQPTPSTKTYCAPLEKLCFDYLSTWTVKSEAVNSASDGIAERVVVSDDTGTPWLSLQTGMGGIGGTCGADDGSYSKILETHTTGIHGSYLVNESAKDYMVDMASAIRWISYDATAKHWTGSMELNDSTASQSVGKVGPCDIGIGVINGKNAKAEGSNQPGAVEFSYYTGKNANPTTYATEAEASAALSTTAAMKAYAILTSARYQ